MSYEQTSWIPKTELDEATAVLAHLLEERKAKAKSMGTAETNYEEACERVQQQHVVDALQAQMPAADPAPVEGDAEEYEEAEVIDDDARQIEGDTLDPETGEVTSREERGEGSVRVWWPEADEPEMTDVGEHTQYAELVADFLASVQAQGLVDDLRNVNAWCVVGIGDGRTRELHAAIAAEDHGLEFAVVLGDAENLEADLRTCANCGDTEDCNMVMAEPDTGCGCGGHAWKPVAVDAEEVQAA